MNLEDYLMKEYEVAREAYRHANEVKHKFVNLAFTLLVGAFTLVVSQKLPDQLYLVVSALLIMTCAYLCYLSHRQMCAAGTLRISEFKLTEHAKQQFNNVPLFDLSTRTIYIRDGHDHSDSMARVIRLLAIVVVIVFSFFLTHKGIAAWNPTRQLYWTTMASHFATLLILGALVHRQDSGRKDRYRRILKNNNEVPTRDA